MKGLTKKQRDILDFIQKFIHQHHYSPSYREIMEQFSLSSPGSIYKYIQTLKRKGVLLAEKQCSRSLSLTAETPPTPPHKSDMELPFIGNISSRYPIEIFRESQSLAVPASLFDSPENTYLLRTQGESFSEESINDGDLLLVEARQEAQAGEMIIALINQHEIIIKRYYPEGQYIRLEGKHHQPLILRQDSILIQGILIGLIRTY